ncbi:hypothetical protein ACLOJK_035141, partial [Asimina triloba]
APITIDHWSTIIWCSTISHGASMAAPKPAAHPSHGQISGVKSLLAAPKTHSNQAATNPVAPKLGPNMGQTSGQEGHRQHTIPKCPDRDQWATHLTNSIWVEPIANEQRLHPSKIRWSAAPCPDLAAIRQPFITSVHRWSIDHGVGHRRLQQQKSILISRQTSRSSIHPEPPAVVLQAGNEYARQTISSSNTQQYTSFQPSKKAATISAQNCIRDRSSKYSRQTRLGPAADKKATREKPCCRSNKQG